MSCFPWEQASAVRPAFICSHCREGLKEEGNKVIVCSCEGSISGQREERQRMVNFHREREEALEKKDHKVRHGG
jgi:hypothetical protein